MGMQITEQSVEIQELNDRYKDALREKVDLYDELVESVKELVNRNSRFMKNEIELCRLVNECAVMKRELEQKEKTVEDLKKQNMQKSGNDRALQQRIEDRIQHKQEMLRTTR